jgi:hypothetical protein
VINQEHLRVSRRKYFILRRLRAIELTPTLGYALLINREVLMKSSLCFAAILSFLNIGIALAGGGDFCEGFERGYATGYKQASGSSIEPISPICPIQPIKKLSDPDSDFEHGYIIGLETGLVESRQ